MCRLTIDDNAVSAIDNKRGDLDSDADHDPTNADGPRELFAKHSIATTHRRDSYEFNRHSNSPAKERQRNEITVHHSGLSVPETPNGAESERTTAIGARNDSVNGAATHMRAAENAFGNGLH